MLNVLGTMLRAAQPLVKDWRNFLNSVYGTLSVWDSSVARQIQIMKRKDRPAVKSRWSWKTRTSPGDWTTWRWTDIKILSWDTAEVDVEITGVPSSRRRRYYDDYDDSPDPISFKFPYEVELEGYANIHAKVLARAITENAKRHIAPENKERVHSIVLEMFGSRAASTLWNIMADYIRHADLGDVLESAPGEELAEHIEADAHDSDVQSFMAEHMGVIPSKAPKVQWVKTNDGVTFYIDVKGVVEANVDGTLEIEYDDPRIP